MCFLVRCPSKPERSLSSMRGFFMSVPRVTVTLQDEAMAPS